MNAMRINEKSGWGRGGQLILTGQCDRPELVRAHGLPLLEAAGRLPDLVKFDRRTGEFRLQNYRNAYVRSGLRNALLREFGLGGTAVGAIGVDNNTTAVTVNTRFLHGAGAGTAANSIIKALSPAATIVTDGSSVVQVVTAGATFVNADFTSGVFIWNKIGFLTTTTDADGNLIDVIGGTGGASPYNRTFGLDLTSAGTFTVIAQIAVTATAI